MYYSFFIIKAFEKKNVFKVKRKAYIHSGRSIFKLVKTGTYKFLSC